MRDLPIGHLVTVVLVAWCTLFALRRRGRPVQHLEPELPVRFETVVNAVEAFAAWMRSREKAERM